MINRPRGTKDLYDDEMEIFEFIEQNAKEVFEAANIGKIQTPVFEFTELFARGVGNDTDIVQKEMYTFMDKGDRSLTLRPEGTAGAVRAYLENGMSSLPSPKKLWYMIPIYRYENVQKGRQREFNQIGVEYFGSPNAEADLEVIYIGMEILKKLGISDDVVLKINSIGCKKCREEYKKALKKALKDKINTYCEDCQRRYDSNILRVLDCKVEHDKAENENLPSILDYLCDDCKKHFEKLKNMLEKANVKYEINDKIVRGLDYYNRTVFEILDKDGLAILGGGRYDGLSEVLGGENIPAVGFAMGVERIVGIIKDKKVDYKNKNKKVFVITEDFSKGFKITTKLREKGVLVEQDLLGRSVRSALKKASKQNFEFVIFVNDTNFVLKNMENGKETEFLEEEKLINEILNVIK